MGVVCRHARTAVALAGSVAVAGLLAPSPISASTVDAAVQGERSGSLIVGGTAPNRADTGWFAIVQARPKVLCGGSVIGSRWIITAAHCVSQTGPIRRAAAYINPSSFDGANFRVVRGAPVAWKRVFVHPQYSASAQRNDVALIRTAKPMTARTLPYSSDAAGPLAGEDLTAFGFGLTSANGAASRVLHQVTVQDRSGPGLAGSCAVFNTGNDIEYDPASMLCAGAESGGKDACYGDSGGPLTTSSDPRTLVGTVSWGYGCADALYPGVYARASTFARWIQATTGIAPNTPSAGSTGPGYIVAASPCRSRCRLARGRTMSVQLTNIGGRAARWRVRTKGLRASPRRGTLAADATAAVLLSAGAGRGKCTSFRIMQGRRAVAASRVSTSGRRC